MDGVEGMVAEGVVVDGVAGEVTLGRALGVSVVDGDGVV